MGDEKKGLELGPGLVGWVSLFPQLTIVIEHSSLEYQLIYNADNLKRGVWGIPGHGVIDGAFKYAAAGNTPYTLLQVVGIAYQLIFQTGMFNDNFKL